MTQMTRSHRLTQRTPTPTDSAVHTVFHCPELLETLLLNLDMRTLLHTQRVSRQFKATITGSLKLQRALWFLPDPNIFANDKFQVVGNPMIMEQDESNFPWATFDVNSCLRRIIPVLWLDTQYGVNFNEVWIVPPATTARPGSWRSMLLAQPFDQEKAYRFEMLYNRREKILAVTRRYTEAPTLGEKVDDVHEWTRFIRAERQAGRPYEVKQWDDMWPLAGQEPSIQNDEPCLGG